jgi:hypothetical protein
MRRLDTTKDESQPVWPTPAPAPAAPAAPVAAMAPTPATMAAAPQERSVTMTEQRAQIAKQSELNKALVAPQSSADLVGSSQRSAVRSAAPAALSENMASAKSAADKSVPEAWDTLLVQTGGHAVTLDLAQGRKLFALMQRLQSSLSTEQDNGQSGPTKAPDLLIKVQAQEQVIATFTLSGRFARWNRPGRVVLIATLSDAQITQLMQAAHEASLGESLH